MYLVNDSELNCSALDLPEWGICMEHPEEMLKPWKNNPIFFEIMIAHIVTFLFGVFGNVVVIVVMAGDRKSRSATNSFLVSLAVGDLLMLCIYGPLETYSHFVIRWDEDGAICKTAKMAELVSAISSVLNLLAVTIERFVVIVFPMKSRTLCTVSNMVKAVLGVWFLSLLLSVPVLFTTGTYKILFTNNVTSITLNYCNDSLKSPIFAVYQFFIIFAIPSVIMTVCYACVIHELWASTRKMNMLTNGVSFRTQRKKPSSLQGSLSNTNSDADYTLVEFQSGKNFCKPAGNKIVRQPASSRSFRAVRKSLRGRSSKKGGGEEGKGVCEAGHFVTANKDEANTARKQVIKMLISVVILFFICWGPRVTMTLLQKLNLIEEFNQTVYRMRITFNIMTFFHGCINPFIYSFMSKNFRMRFIKYLEKCGCRKKAEYPTSKLLQNSASQKSHPGTSVHRHEVCGRCQEETERHKPATGSYISCDTKNTELESVLCLASGGTANVVCFCPHRGEQHC